MLLYLMLITVLALLALNIFFFKKDLLSPPVIVCAVFTVSILCAVYCNKYWNFEIHFETYALVCGGLAIFSAASLFTELIFNQNKKITNSNSELSVIGFPPLKNIILIVLTLISSIWYAYEIISVSKKYGYVSTISQVTSIYRAAASYGVISIENDVNVFCKAFFKLCQSISYLSLYIFINNIIVTKKVVKQIKYIIPCIIYMFFSLFSAGRYQIIRLVSAAIFLYYILYVKHNGGFKNQYKFIIRCFLIFIAFCVFFVLSREIVGRASNSDPVYYIAFYAGGSIPLLDSFLINPPLPSDIWGKETFYAINAFLGRYFGIKELQYITHHEFRYSLTGINMGNVYTVFRRIIYDFGYTGVIILYPLCAIFYTIFYNKIKASNVNTKIDLRILTYAFISFGLTMQFYEEAFYSSVISVNTLTVLIMVFLLKWFLMDTSLIVNGRRIL